MSNLTITDRDIARLTGLADTLLPERGDMPSASALRDFGLLLHTAIGAGGYPDQQVRDALDALPPKVDRDGAKAFAENRVEQFNVLSVLTSAAYFMAPEILRKLGFPADRRQPAGTHDFADEFETGILDPVSERGPRFRNTAAPDAQEAGR